MVLVQKEIKRIMMRPGGVEKQIRPVIPDYLCFTANTASSTVKITKTENSSYPLSAVFEYSTDGSTWTSYTINNTITLSSIGDKVYFRNTSDEDTTLNRGIVSSGNVTVWSYYQFVMTGSIAASGDVTYLINKNGTTNSKQCPNLFYGCTSLTTPPKLPATELSTMCYYQMFYGCTNLEVLPELPATDIKSCDYRSMFYGCTKIKVSETQTGEYQTEYRMPTTGTGTEGTNSFVDMFKNTGGTFAGTPTINTTYYTSNTLV